MKIRTEKVIDVQEWDKLVRDTYGKPYRFQQQDGCQGRGNFYLTVPDEEAGDFPQESVPEVVNHRDMGVSFKAWLERDPKQSLKDDKESRAIGMWWERNFYPSIQILANNLHAKGLLEAGEYTIDIDW